MHNMNFLKNKLYSFTDYFVKKKQPTKAEPKEITKCQVYFDHVYHILSWENVSYTLFVFLALNYLFWLMVQVEIKIFGFIFLLCLVLFIWDSFFTAPNHGPSFSQHSSAFESTRIVFYDTISNLKTFRKENPTMFCISLSIVFFILRIIASTITGYEAIYFMLLITFFIPLVIKFLPEETTEAYKNQIKSVFNNAGVLAEEELIPFINEKDFTRDNDMDSLLTDKTADSVSTSLISGITSMPSHLDEVDFQNDVQEEDLLPNKNISYDLSSDSDSEHKAISFDSSHFSKESSSEDEHLLEQDLALNNYEDDSRDSTLSGTFLNIVKSIVYKKETPVKRQNSRSSDSSSDFEFVNSEDIK